MKDKRKAKRADENCEMCTEALKESIIAVIDLAGTAANSALGLLDNLPIFDIACKTIQTGKKIIIYIDKRKFTKFFSLLLNKNLDKDKGIKYVHKLETNSRFKNKQMKFLLETIEKNSTEQELSILSNLFINLINGNIVEEDFYILVKIAQNNQIIDYEALKFIYERHGASMDDFTAETYNMLHNLVLIENQTRINDSQYYTVIDGTEEENKAVILSRIGRLFCLYGLNFNN